MKIGCLVISLMFFNVAFSQDINFKHLGVAQNLTSNTCFQVSEDSSGLIFIGTNRGFSTFDGKSIVNYTVEQHIPDPEVLNICHAKSGKSWLCTYSGKLSYYLNGNIVRLPDSFTSNIKRPVLYIDEISDSVLIMAAGSKALVNIHSGGKIDKQIWVSSIERIGNLIYGYGLDTAFILNTKTNERKYYRIKYHAVNSHYSNIHKGRMLYALENKVWLFDYATGNSKPVICHEDLMQVKRIYFIDSWVYLIKNGNGIALCKLKNNTIEFHSILLENEICNGIFIDSRNTIWISTRFNGVFYCNHFLNKLNSISQHAKVQLAQRYVQVKCLGEDLYTLNGLYSAHRFNKSTKEFEANPTVSNQILKDYKSGEFKNFQSNELKITLGYGYERVLVYMPNQEKLSFITPYRTGAATYYENAVYYVNKNKIYVYDLLKKTHKLWIEDEIWNISELLFVNQCLFVATMGNGIYIYKKNKKVLHLNQHTGLPGGFIPKIRNLGNTCVLQCESQIIQLKLNGEVWKIEKIITPYNSNISKPLLDFEVFEDKLFGLLENAFVEIVENTLPKYKVNILFDKLQIGDIVYFHTSNRYKVRYTGSAMRIHFRVVDFFTADRTKTYYRINHQQWEQTLSNFIEIVDYNRSNLMLEIKYVDFDGTVLSKSAVDIVIQRKLLQTWEFYTVVSFFLMIALLYFLFRLYRAKQRQELEKKSRQNELLKLEQKANQALMHPHFIFNILNSIQNFINQNKKEEANLYLSKFAKLIRLNLSFSGNSQIAVEDEIAILDKYLELEKLRIGHEFEYEFVLQTEEIHDLKIPSMMLQPIVENAIWHGLDSRPHQKKLSIEWVLIENSTKLMISITDNGVGLDPSKKRLESKESHRSIALENIQNRLDLLGKMWNNTFPFETVSPVFGDTDYPGTCIRITLPIE